MKQIEELEKALIVVDMVNGFVRQGAMKDNYIERIIPKIEELIRLFNKEGEGVIFIKDTHEKNSLEFKKFPEHCIKNSTEAELVDELKKYEKKSLVYEKNSTSAIFAPYFMEDISKMKNLKEVLITGCCTDICVMNLAVPLVNYFDQENKAVKVMVFKDATETFNAPNHNRDEYNAMAYKLMSQAGIEMIKKYK